MKKTHRKIPSLGIVLTIIYFTYAVILLMGCREGAIPSKIISKDDIVKVYKCNIKKFEIVAEYLKNIKEDVYIESTVGNKITIEKDEDNSIKPFEVNEKKVKDNIKYILHKLHYKYIREDGKNGIYFVRQTSLRFAQGIAYSKDGKKPDWGTVEKLEKISCNWYYYKGY